VVYIAEEGLCDIGKLLRQQHIVEGSSALSRAGAHDVRETTLVTVTPDFADFPYKIK
jgi:hypothetical protein